MLVLKNIQKTYGDISVLNNINFDVKRGELVCILGPSGCGKSTLLNIIGGFVKEDQGEIYLDKKKINDCFPEDRDVATVFQSYGLFPHKNVIENIKYGLKFRKIDKKDRDKLALDMLKKVELEGYEKKKIDELSGGEKQRVALARSLILNPEILLLDEPFSSLDANLRVIMRRELKRIQREFRVTTLIVTHDQEDAFDIADRIIVLNKGEIEQIDSVDDIYSKPKNKFILEFVGKSNTVEINNKIFYCRYEDVLINNNKESNGRITDKKFKGSFIEYKIELDKGGILYSIADNKKNYLINDRINVEFKYKELKEL